MRKVLLSFVAGLLLFTGCDNAKKSSRVSLNSTIDSVSYAIGIDQGKYLTQALANFPDSLNNAAIIDGFTQTMLNAETQFSDTLGKAILNKFMPAKQEEEKAKQNLKYVGNLEEGKAYLAENATKEGVVVTPSGLQYKVIKEGNGPKPINGDKVKVNYEGKLINGTVFDSSFERGKPVEFTLDQVIPGWTEGLKLMPVGSTFMLYVPQDIAYGENVRPGGPIEPFSTLIFRVELLEIVK